MTRETFPGLTSRNGETIQITIRYNSMKLYETIKLKPTIQNLRKVSKIRNDIHEEIRKGIFNYHVRFPQGKNADKFKVMKGDNKTIGDRLDQRLKDLLVAQTDNEITRSTMRGYKRELRSLDKAFGNLYLNQLTNAQVQAWADRSNVVIKTINNRLNHLRTIINEALTDGAINRNILYAWSPKVKKKSQHKIDPFTANEVKKILKVTKKIAPEIHSLFLLRFAMGMRPGEIFGLRWDRYDAKKGEILIKETNVNGHKKDSPKTTAGIRKLKLNTMGKLAIEHQRSITKDDYDNVFINPNTLKPWRYAAISKRWKRILKVADVRYRVPYTTRHTCATELFKSGKITAAALQGFIGHKSINTTMEYYITGASLEVNDAAAAMDKVFK